MSVESQFSPDKGASVTSVSASGTSLPRSSNNASSVESASVNDKRYYDPTPPRHNTHASVYTPPPTGGRTYSYSAAPSRAVPLIPSGLPPVDQWREGLRLFCESSDPPVILVDMDNTLVNWESQFERLMGKHFPQIPLVPPLERTQFKIELNYDDEYRDPILHLTSLDEFWLSMDPIRGAVDALQDMARMGIIVFIVTTPDAKHTSRSAFEKIAWVERHLGSEWKFRSILTHDKTLVNGDILIDDKPAASVGLLRPSWTHMLFAQPYNVHHGQCPRLDQWSDWGPVIYRALIEREHQKRNVLHGLANDNPRFTVTSLRSTLEPQLSTDHLNVSRVRPVGRAPQRVDECCGSSRFGSPLPPLHTENIPVESSQQECLPHQAPTSESFLPDVVQH